MEIQPKLHESRLSDVDPAHEVHDWDITVTVMCSFCTHITVSFDELSSVTSIF